MNIYAEFQTRIEAIVEAMKADGLLPETTAADAITVEAPRDASHGDLSTNAAMVLAKPAQKKPRELAEHIAAELAKAPDVAATEIAGPGFINIRLKETVWFGVVSAVLEAKMAYGQSDLGRSRRVNVEYVSANPTGPMHVGHCRGAVFGDALANLLAAAGYAVTREYYINDAGAQVDVLARSAHVRYRQALGEDIGEIPAGLYPGDYLVPVGEALAKKYKKKLLKLPEAEWLPIVRAFAIDAMMAMIRDDLAALKIQHDVFFSERSLQQGTPNRVEATIQHLRERGLIYEGRLPPPKGAPSDEWEDREQTLFRATDFGDEVDRALIKADGSYTYFASDMAYHYDKYARDFRALINVWGADHGGYVSRMQAAVAALTEGHAELDVKLIQLVKLLRNGEPVKMSKRSGSFVTLREVVEEVGRDPVRFMMLYRKNDAALDFDFAKVTEKSRENPVFYVQYAHARGHSSIRKAREAFPDLVGEDLLLEPDALQALTDAAELTVMKKLAAYPNLVAAAARAHEPHRLAFYLYDLASDFHVLYNRGKELPHLRFIREDDRSLTEARVALVVATTHVLAAGLAILGVSAPTEM